MNKYTIILIIGIIIFSIYVFTIRKETIYIDNSPIAKIMTRNSTLDVVKNTPYIISTNEDIKILNSTRQKTSHFLIMNVDDETKKAITEHTTTFDLSTISK